MIMKKYFKILFFLLLVSSEVHAVEQFVLKSESTFNPTYQNRFSFLLGVNPSIQKARDVTNFTFSYGKKFEDYWLDTNFLITNGIFNKITTNNPTATGLTSDQLVDTKSSMTTIGVGIGRETRYAQTLLPFKDIYELMAANLTYNIYKENTSGKSFTGPGMIAKFSLYKRFSDYFSAGTQFTYNLAVVKRTQDPDTETSSIRSLTMSYLTLGFDLSFYL
jgi:hypothetical protein